MTSAEHSHDFRVLHPALAGLSGWPTAAATLEPAIAAAYAGCAACLRPLIEQLARDSLSAARLMELTCESTTALLGFVPPNLLDGDAPGPPSQAFRLLARCAVTDPASELATVCEQMDLDQRIAAVDDALGILTGQLMASTSGDVI